MKVVNSEFCTKDLKSILLMSTTVKRLTKDGRKNRPPVGDLRVGYLSDLEMGRDKIEVAVYDGSKANVVARCTAHLSVVSKCAGFKAGQHNVFNSGLQASIRYGAQKLYDESQRMATYDKPFASVLTIESIEVLPVYQRMGIGSSILDQLFFMTKPDYATALILPNYITMAKGAMQPATTDITGTSTFFKKSKFRFYGKQGVLLAGCSVQVPFYVV